MSGTKIIPRAPDFEKGRRSLGRAKTNDSLNLLQNDDEEEQKRRQHERILEQQRMNLNSPSTPQDKRVTHGTGVAGLSNAQLASHYADCIRLSTENKITVKNAFGLHLIDYMSEMIKSKEGTTNFQVASCTLDASTKIYAYRVDCVHAETLKMAGGLGMVDSQKKRKADKDGDEEAAALSGEDEPKKRKNKTKKGATIEQNMKNITMNPAELEFEMDPLFQKMTLMYDEGGVTGLLTNNLMYSDDYCELSLDPSILPPPLDRSLRRTEEPVEIKYNISKFKESLLSVKNRSICPTFATFEFLNCNDVEVEFKNSFIEGDKSDYAYDPSAGDRSPSGMDDCGTDNDFDEAPMQDENNVLMDTTQSEFRLGCAPARTPGRVEKPADLADSFTDMASMLAAQPSEYSYFDKNLVAVWAGPSHWKIKPFSKSKEATEEGKTAQRKRTKKVVPRLKIDLDVEVQVVLSDKYTLPRFILQRWTTDKITLPEDLHYDCQRIKTFLIHPVGSKIKVSTPSKAVDAGQDDRYNYDNANDCENFCPTAADDSSGDEGGLGDVGLDDNTELGNFSLTQGTQSTGIGPSSNAGFMSFTGDNLMQQPYKLEKFNLAYERTAKKVDVLKVKKTMWGILSQTIESTEEPASDEMPSSMTFTELVKTLPKYVSETTAKNVTVPIAFVSLLHLVNEKNLKITGREDLSDFTLEQD